MPVDAFDDPFLIRLSGASLQSSRGNGFTVPIAILRRNAAAMLATRRHDSAFVEALVHCRPACANANERNGGAAENILGRETYGTAEKYASREPRSIASVALVDTHSEGGCSLSWRRRLHERVLEVWRRECVPECRGQQIAKIGIVSASVDGGRIVYKHGPTASATATYRVRRATFSTTADGRNRVVIAAVVIRSHRSNFSCSDTVRRVDRQTQRVGLRTCLADLRRHTS